MLAGGFGGAKLSHGLSADFSRPPAKRGSAALELSVIVNTGDDLEMHGLPSRPTSTR